MKLLTSAILGASLLFVGATGAVDTAAARSNVGVYIGPNGIGISVERQRRYCRDYEYRYRHRYICDRYYPYYRYRSNDYYRHDGWRNRHRHHDYYRYRDHRW